jgi:hypothetical protein
MPELHYNLLHSIQYQGFLFDNETHLEMSIFNMQACGNVRFLLRWSQKHHIIISYSKIQNEKNSIWKGFYPY